ncbi:glycerophosphodiester phosphodiesterase family protein [Vibrio mangrovi]|uniref:Glycerophosphodiester phosphodiesterase family protein n=1 Tax=Vibrio mangrovi TaxID=474394 RepID=A0A1Y6INB6_9VIBR|nr:glycerophosphodiester phosphodiesterase family protein [Vibrio mangrovi]MDW6004066.1 glycerophosphodiester phosphodiesterase family protein [Vibrio mangrovi]SMR99136.1 Glycerophosphoryl diester phosphodiesterase [Vibrio mangrovi]
MSPLIVGHRGVAGSYPENTQASIMAAIQLGLRWVEVDIQPTQDQELVVCHDHKIDRCSNGSGRVDHHTLQQLQQFDFGSWFSPEFAGEKIMTLQQLLQLAKTSGLHVNLEVKLDHHAVGPVITRLKKELQENEISPDAILLSSFHHDVMREMSQQLPGFRLGVLTERVNRKIMRLIDETSAFSCHVNARWLTKRQIKKLREKEVEIWCYTVNNPRFRWMSEVDAIFSDVPERFLS